MAAVQQQAVSTVKEEFHASLGDFLSLTRQLLEQVSGDNRPQQSVSAGTSVVPGGGVSMILDHLVKCDRNIQVLTETALTMRSRQKEIAQVEGELERKHQEMADLLSHLQEAEKIMETAIFHGKQKLDSIRNAEEGAVSPEALIRYAHRISQASSVVSPVGWQPSDPRRPYPIDTEMRSGWLGQATLGGICPVPLTTNGNAVKLANEGGGERGQENNEQQMGKPLSSVAGLMRAASDGPPPDKKMALSAPGLDPNYIHHHRHQLPPPPPSSSSASRGVGPTGAGGGGGTIPAPTMPPPGPQVPGVSSTGVSSAAGGPPGRVGGGRFDPFAPGTQSFQSVTLEEPEIMSEDSSPSSSDEET